MRSLEHSRPSMQTARFLQMIQIGYLEAGALRRSLQHSTDKIADVIGATNLTVKQLKNLKQTAGASSPPLWQNLKQIPAPGE